MEKQSPITADHVNRFPPFGSYGQRGPFEGRIPNGDPSLHPISILLSSSPQLSAKHYLSVRGEWAERRNA